MTELHEFEFESVLATGELAATEIGDSEHPKGRDILLNWRKPRPALSGRAREVGDKSIETVVMRGMPTLYPNSEDEPEDQQYAFDLWEPYALLTSSEVAELRSKGLPNDKVMLPGSKIVVGAQKMLRHTKPGSGEFSEWLVDQLAATTTKDNKSKAWPMVPPPLFLEGEKVQTPWLFRFLKEPEQIRFGMALRMPRFNMSDEEARSLANYFSAKDGVPYPYQEMPQADPTYMHMAAADFHIKHPMRDLAKGSYLDESWKMLTATLCIKCHAVGGRPFATDPSKPNDPNVTQGPNLERVAQRLRPDWVKAWLHNPKWITPYTAMPLPFPRGKSEHLPLFDGNPGDQTIGVFDALMNYHQLLERQPRSTELVAPATPTDAKQN